MWRGKKLTIKKLDLFSYLSSNVQIIKCFYGLIFPSSMYSVIIRDMMALRV